MTTEIKVGITLYYSTEEGISEAEAIENVKQLVAEELNGKVSEWAEYEVVSRG